MVAKPTLTLERWLEVQERWESDPRPGFKWVVDEMRLPVSKEAVRKRAFQGEWAKGGATNTGRAQSDAFAAPADLSVPVRLPAMRRVRRPLVKVAGDDMGNLREGEGTIGRPTYYREEFNESAKRLALLGLTDEQIAGALDIGITTFYEWQKTHEGFRESVRAGKLDADGRVAEALYKRAIGYTHPSEKLFLGKDADGASVVIRAETVEHYAPDTQAASRWLFNRQPERWRDRVEVKQEIDMRVFPKEELERIYAESFGKTEDIHGRVIEGRAERLGIQSEYVGGGGGADADG